MICNEMKDGNTKGDTLLYHTISPRTSSSVKAISQQVQVLGMPERASFNLAKKTSRLSTEM